MINESHMTCQRYYEHEMRFSHHIYMIEEDILYQYRKSYKITNDEEVYEMIIIYETESTPVDN